ncbi:MAG: hypothetical protein IT371_31220 [Deltaproteobacteria bacterium]|nr:hypothetical protein [Deltaproteobacteria bacterium]
MRKHEKKSFERAIARLDTNLAAQTSRTELLQRWLDEQGARLEELGAHLAASAARLERLLGGPREGDANAA